MKRTNAVTSANGYQNNAEVNGMNGARNDEGGCNLLALLCAALCPSNSNEGANRVTNVNFNNNAQPYTTTVTNGEGTEKLMQLTAFHVSRLDCIPIFCNYFNTIVQLYQFDNVLLFSTNFFNRYRASRVL